MTIVIADPPTDEPHTHVHNWVGGERRFTHSHPPPVDVLDENAARPHRHSNGEHSHPHGHDIYEGYE